MRWLLPVFGLAVLTRVAAQVMLGSFSHVTTFEYEEIATNLLAGQGYSYASADGGIYVASQSSPLYIVLTAGVYALTNHSQAAMLIVQAILGGLTAALVGWLGARFFFTPASGLFAGVLVALDPALVFYAAELHSLTLDALANVVIVTATLVLALRPTTGRAGLAGALFGLSALTRATALVLLPFHMLWLIRSRALRLLSLPAAAMLVVAVLVYSPWPARNTLLLGQLSLGSSETTEWLWRGNNPNANGGGLTLDNQRMLDLAPPEFHARILAASESERVTLYRDAALDFIQADPAAALRLYADKLLTFWWGSDETGLLYPASFLLGYRIWYVFVLVSAALGARLALVGPRRDALVLIVGSMLIVCASQALFYVEGRHRMAIEPLLLIFSGAALAWLLGRAARLRRRTPQGLGSHASPLPSVD